VSPFLFWIFAFVMLVFGCSVVAQKNPVSSALSLVVSFIALAALFVSLDAFFIGVIQVLVYAGAVMVLFLFIIMLLDLRGTQRRRYHVATLAGGLLITVIFVVQLVHVLDAFPESRRGLPPLAAPVSDVKSVGHVLFTSYNLPFQIVAVLVLVATIGVVVLSKRELD
jgi:NADH-quinone oxidoreductase subunit J